MNSSPKTLLIEVIDDKDASLITGELLKRWQGEGNHQKLIDYHAACLRLQSAHEAAEEAREDAYANANEWCIENLGVDLNLVWQDSQDLIQQAMPPMFRSGALWIAVKPICLELGIPSDVIDLQRIGKSSNKATLKAKLVSSLADFGLRKSVRWWTRQKIDGVSYLVKTSDEGSNLLDFPAAN